MKSKSKLTVIAVGLIFANTAFAQVPDTCVRVKAAGKEAATKKISKRIAEARKTYRLYKDLRKECQDFINSIPVADIAQMGTITPAVSPGVTAAIKVAVEEYVIPEVQDRIRSVCKDVNDAYKNKVEDFEDKVLPPSVTKTGREAERRIKDWEKEIEKTESEKDAPPKVAAKSRTMTTASFKFEGKQDRLLAQVTSSPEFKSFSQSNPFASAPQFVPDAQDSTRTTNASKSPITSAYERSIAQPLPPMAPQKPATQTVTRPTSPQVQKEPSASGSQQKQPQERNSFFKDMFGGK